MKIIKDWIAYPWLELILVCLTPFICALGIVLFPSLFHEQSSVNTLWWVLLILCIDVAHVYTTIYRTYLDRIQWKQHRRELIFIPLLSYAASILLYQIGIELFWRVIAYTAVFHFIRQQYGFMKVYDRKHSIPSLEKINTAMVYAATLYPLVYWHCYGPFQFNWFTSEDFLYLKSPALEQVARVLYFSLCAIFLGLNIYTLLRKRQFNLPVFLIISGTALSWYLGIVYFKSDLTFTLLNVVSHGVPYMALVWIYGKKSATLEGQFSFFKHIFKSLAIPLFLIIPLILAFIEEGLWDSLVWQDHVSVFKPFNSLKSLFSTGIKSLIIPLLIVPQLTHYILDGFIWKVSKGHLK